MTTLDKMITILVAQQTLKLREDIGPNEVQQGFIVMDDSEGHRHDVKVTATFRAPRKMVFEVDLSDHVLSAITANYVGG